MARCCVVNYIVQVVGRVKWFCISLLNFASVLPNKAVSPIREKKVTIVFTILLSTLECMGLRPLTLDTYPRMLCRNRLISLWKQLSPFVVTLSFVKHNILWTIKFSVVASVRATISPTSGTESVYGEIMTTSPLLINGNILSPLARN